MGYKNKQDLYEYQKRRWVNRKVEAILYKGGKCAACGIEYNGENGAIFDFHHINPEEKELEWGKIKSKKLGIYKERIR